MVSLLSFKKMGTKSSKASVPAIQTQHKSPKDGKLKYPNLEKHIDLLNNKPIVKKPNAKELMQSGDYFYSLEAYGVAMNYYRGIMMR
jgi:hypothetical protein